MAEDTIKQVLFPVQPLDISEEMKQYLIELERVLQEALIGSMYMNKVIQDGIIGT